MTTSDLCMYSDKYRMYSYPTTDPVTGIKQLLHMNECKSSLYYRCKLYSSVRIKTTLKIYLWHIVTGSIKSSMNLMQMTDHSGAFIEFNTENKHMQEAMIFQV